ncbi:MAG: aminotransferase class V-fold PLP-dependent enzyme [Verrucomicrobiae bacterium]|nr:aminotransferase class V-fold PLP-dependent enzyme [Verrucomicrobiae bacterium]
MEAQSAVHVAGIHLDDHSSSTHEPQVSGAMMTWLKAGASSGAGSMERRAAIGLARERAARLLGAGNDEEIIFTSGAAESVNMAVKGVALAARGGGRIVLGSVEHVDVLNSARWLASCGFVVSRLWAGEDGCVDLHELRPAC